MRTNQETHKNNTVTCGFCGYVFDPRESTAACQACPLHAVCNKVKCPRCGFEVAVPSTPWVVQACRRLWEGLRGLTGSDNESDPGRRAG